MNHKLKKVTFIFKILIYSVKNVKVKLIFQEIPDSQTKKCIYE